MAPFANKKRNLDVDSFSNWSGRRDLNPRHQPWQGCALPLSYTRILLRFYIMPQIKTKCKQKMRKKLNFTIFDEKKQRKIGHFFAKKRQHN